MESRRIVEGRSNAPAARKVEVALTGVRRREIAEARSGQCTIPRHAQLVKLQRANAQHIPDAVGD
jgi:hypothetical protein